jgi:hypothetical protein
MNIAIRGISAVNYEKSMNLLAIAIKKCYYTIYTYNINFSLKRKQIIHGHKSGIKSLMMDFVPIFRHIRVYASLC